MDLFQCNFYFFGSALASSFGLFVSQFFLSLKERTRPALHLGLFSFFFFLFHLGYVIGFSSSAEWTVYHRLIVIPSSMVIFIEIFTFFFYFPEPKGVKIGNTIRIILYTIASFFGVYYIYSSLNAPKAYNIGSHYWDFESHGFYKWFSLFILLMTLFFIIAGIWRAFVSKGKERRAVIYFLIGFCVVGVLPGIMNSLSRDGSVSRASYQQTTDLSLVIGLFLIVILYANVTKERTTILSRITAITMATCLLTLQLVGYFVLNGYDDSFDQIRNQEIKAIVNEGETPDGLIYLTSYTPKSDKFDFPYKKEIASLNTRTEFEMRFTHLRILLCNLGNLKGKERWKKSQSILEEAPPEFFVYKAGIKEFLASKKESAVSDSEMASFFNLLTDRFGVIRSKYLHLPNKADKSSVLNLLKDKDPSILAGLSTLKRSLENESFDADGKASEKILLPISPMIEPGKRIYRILKSNHEGNETNTFTVSYMYKRPDNDSLFEIGFQYGMLRNFNHSPSLIFVYSLIAVVLVVSIGFRYFFRLALVIPLNEVVDGLQAINAGDLNYRLQPRVEDEVGFIARSFNRMARSIQAGRKRLDRYAKELEHKVKERTIELENTLSEVRELKRLQDGDFFLTSLLIKPLGSNKSESKDVKVDFFLEQKKKFTFKNREDEIGGDLNVSNNIQLNGHPYVVFLNGDAMGKSMQGAGGALVLGAVLESIVERTKNVESVRSKSPERWLKDTFIELHKVFESFEGSMLVSCMMGLIDETTGSLLYINAEHPRAVLYKDEKAGFIGEKFNCRKLGTTGIEGNIRIETFQLSPGDSIIVGSDGRDDILIGNASDGNRIINDDEELFLKMVEEGEGNLNSIYEAILREGELIDDISMIRLSYKGSVLLDHSVDEDYSNRVKELLSAAKKAENEENLVDAIAILEKIEALDPRVPRVKKKLIKLFLKNGKYDQAARYAEDYLQLRPIDNEILFISSVIARKVGELNKAVELGERLRLRDPEHLNNLISLSRVYMTLKNYGRSKILLSAALKINPESEMALKLSNALSKITPNS
ncbi:SpoIIE-like protein phosphatase domain protein [Leptospira fainei serovar Hurstbridge str. BUT 6]|uniref:SpoIIE-like protein phosphatase domain protein n=1 Tax=Leptospira fainei serovar Hurstbridge str. BUT 6 TaxID=1193011 RepID=S3V485_9LEPT|nr:SpoIIE family protein phosphatase [Leptospira fainei]EPG76248.1 SpoIIE-like protein phosphatase domain protein [Leptospira fainei serovar Hurstbridge str. BUT 6]